MIGFLRFLPSPKDYKESYSTIKVNTEVIGTQSALQELTKIFKIDDIDIQNESLEEIIRGIYEEE